MTEPISASFGWRQECGQAGGVSAIISEGDPTPPVPANCNGDSYDDIGIFRDTSGLWAIRGLIKAYYYGIIADVQVTRQALIFSVRLARSGFRWGGELILWALSLLNPGLLSVLFVLFLF